MMFGSVDSAVRSQIDGTPGRGLIRTVSQAQPQPFQALHVGEQDILDAIRSATANGNVDRAVGSSASTALESYKAEYAMPVVAASEQDANLPGTSAEHATMEAFDVPDMERVQILTLAKAGISRGKICEQLYGARGGRGYTSVKRILDAAGL
jgi:hypothetical protein